MLKAILNGGAYTSGNIPFNVYQNTNNKYAYNSTDNTFDIEVGGLTEVKANIVATGISAGVLSLQLYADGNPISGAIDSQTVANGSTYTFHINDIVKTVLQQNPTFASLALQFSGACTIDGGDVILTYER